MLVIAAVLAYQSATLTIKPNPQLNASESVHFEVKADLANQSADLTALAVLKVTKADEKGSELSIDWKNIQFTSNDSDSDLPFSPFIINLGPDGNLANVTGGTPAADAPRTVMVTFFPKPPSPLELNKPLEFSLPQAKGGVPPVKVTETYQGVDPVGASKAYKVLVKEQETGPDSQDFRLVSTFWVNDSGDVLREDGKFDNLPVTGAGTNAVGTITAKIASSSGGSGESKS